jgi:3-dehydroquinate synthase
VLEDLLDKYHLPKTCEIASKDLLEAAKADKKRRGDSITLVQPAALGSCILHKTNLDELAQVLELGRKL